MVLLGAVRRRARRVDGRQRLLVVFDEREAPEAVVRLSRLPSDDPRGTPRRRRDASLRTIRVAPAAAPRSVPSDDPRGTPRRRRDKADQSLLGGRAGCSVIFSFGGSCGRRRRFFFFASHWSASAATSASRSGAMPWTRLCVRGPRVETGSTRRDRIGSSRASRRRGVRAQLTPRVRWRGARCADLKVLQAGCAEAQR